MRIPVVWRPNKRGNRCHNRDVWLYLGVLALLLGAGIGWGQTLEKTFYVPDSLCGLPEATCAVYNSVDNRVYVGGLGPFVIVVDGSTLCKVARIDISDSVRALALNSTGTRLYGISARSGSITVIDLASGSVKSVISVGRWPIALCYSAKLDKLFCADYSDREVYVIDCGADTVVATIPTGLWSLSLCLDTTGTKLYVANQRYNTLSVIDAVGDSLLKTIAIGSYPKALCCNTKRNKVYCVNDRSTDVAVVDAATDSVVAQPWIGDQCDNVCYNPVDDRIYCGGREAIGLHVICGSGDTVLRDYPTLRRSWSVLHDSANDRIYCGREGEVAILDGASGNILSTLPVDNAHYVLVHQAAPNRVWCVGEQLVAIDADQDTVAASIPVGCWPQTICYSSKSRKIYVGYEFGPAGYVTVIDPATSTVLRTIRVPHFGPVLCYNEAADKIYTGGYADSELSVISCRRDSVVASIVVGYVGFGRICSNPMDKKVYFTNCVSGCVEVIDASRDSVVNSLWIGSHPDYMCYNMANRCLYVNFVGPDSLGWIAVVDSSESVVTTIDTRNTGEHMVINPVTNALYCVDDIGGGVTLIDCDSNRVLRDWWFVQQQFGVAVNTRNNKVYLTGYGRGNLWVLDGATNRLDSIWLGDPIGACHVFYDSVSNHIYCASNRVYVVDCASGTVLDTFPQTMLTYDWQDAFALDPPSSRVFGLDYCKSQVFVIYDTSTVGVAEPVQYAGVRPVMPTFVHGSLELPEGAAIPRGSPIALVDITGRKVADLRPGLNDIRAVVPGVYFVRSGTLKSFGKVVVTRY